MSTNNNDKAIARANQLRVEIKALAALIAREADNETAAPTWATVGTLAHVCEALTEAARSIHPKARVMADEDAARALVLADALAR